MATMILRGIDEKIATALKEKARYFIQAATTNGFFASEDNAPGGFNNPDLNPSDQHPQKKKDNKEKWLKSL